MATCGSCWYADFNPKGEELHAEHYEEDPFSAVLIGGKTKQMRVIKSCFKAQRWFTTFGTDGLHGCKEFADFNEMSAKIEVEEDKRREELANITLRKKVPRGAYILTLIQFMYEADDIAFELMADFIAELNYEKAEKLLRNLNDMNIRGFQVTLAHRFCKRDIKILYDMAEQRHKPMIEYINKNNPVGSIEKVIERGAHRYAHK